MKKDEKIRRDIMRKYVLITGASRGLGYALVLQYLQKGYQVFACARKIDHPQLVALKNQYEDSLIIIPMDVAQTTSVKEAAMKVSICCNQLDLIINNAGIHPQGSLLVLEEVNLDNGLEVYNVNAIGVLRVAKEFHFLLSKGENPILLNISSEAGSIRNCKRSKEYHYCMSKAAMNMGSMLLQNYFKEKDNKIKVLAIHPGWIRTDMGGAGADLDPMEVAGDIFALTEIPHDMNGSIYMDRFGKELEW